MSSRAVDFNLAEAFSMEEHERDDEEVFDNEDDNRSEQESVDADSVSSVVEPHGDTREWVLFDESFCRATFQSGTSPVVRVCGKQTHKCPRKGHGQGPTVRRGPPGVYRCEPPLSVRSPPDGDYGTFQTEEGRAEIVTARRDANRKELYSMAGSPEFKTKTGVARMVGLETPLAETKPAARGTPVPVKSGEQDDIPSLLAMEERYIKIHQAELDKHRVELLESKQETSRLQASLKKKLKQAPVPLPTPGKPALDKTALDLMEDRFKALLEEQRKAFEDKLDATLAAADSKTNTSADQHQPGVEIALSDIPTGRDTSTGKKVYETSINVPTDVLKELCPQGLSKKTRDALGEAIIDVVNLPGTYGTVMDDKTEVWDGLAAALGTVMEVQERSAGRFRTDSQWTSQNRTRLKEVKDSDSLRTLAQNYRDTRGEVLLSAKGAMREVLADCWYDEPSLIYYLEAGRLIKLIESSLDLYGALLSHLKDQLSESGWAIAAIDTAYHTRQLQICRTSSMSRLQAMLKIYVYLRNSAKDAFWCSELQQKYNQAMRETVLASLGSPVLAPGSYKMCSKCGTSDHPGGNTRCPFKGVTNSNATKLALETHRRGGKFITTSVAVLKDHLEGKLDSDDKE
jgi:hypothetical protein